MISLDVALIMPNVQDGTHYRLVLSYPACDQSVDPPCRTSGRLYRCTSVPGTALMEPGQASPNDFCQSAAAAWGVCMNGEWLCECVISPHPQFGPPWRLLCPVALSSSHGLLDWSRGLPKANEFAGYRLGNVIDKWWSYRVNFGGPLHRKYASEFHIMKRFGCPENSFGSFLWQGRNRNIQENAYNLLRNTEYESIALTFWLYSYDAISIILPDFRKVMKDAIRQYVEESGFVIPNVPEGTCVIHYRIGDFLSVGVLEPVAMADAVREWVLQFDLHIERFSIMSSGAVAHSTSLTQAAQSKRLLDLFTSRLSELFIGIPLIIDSAGTPDQDWFKMVNAPMLFTSHGSYAISAALVSDGLRASPAVNSLDAPDCMGRDANRTYAPGWSLFRCVNGFNISNRLVLMPAVDTYRNSTINHTRCYVQDKEYLCAVVEFFMVTSSRQQSPHPRCLGGKQSWGICPDGKFLCSWPDSQSETRTNAVEHLTGGGGEATWRHSAQDGCIINGFGYACRTPVELDKDGRKLSRTSDLCLSDMISSGWCEEGNLLCYLSEA